MLDFIFSFDSSKSRIFSQALQNYRPGIETSLRVFIGSWGTLVTIGKAYPGFYPVETDKYIIVVLGGPLPRKDFTIATGEIKDDGTRWIMDHWKIKKNIIWDEDLVGHFLVVCIDKEMKCIEVVTDINSFVPAYELKLMEQRLKYKITLGSHADALAFATEQEKNIDPISIADFLTYKTVTFPFTMYKNIHQFPPASIINIQNSGNKHVTTYWIAKENNTKISFTKAADQLSKIIFENIKRICEAQNKVNLLMSGGEDSRIIATLLSDNSKVAGITFVDSYNNEARIAEAVSKRLNIKWQYIERKKTHYIENSFNALKLTESHNSFIHAHLNGLQSFLIFNKVTLGALFSDSLFKACWAPFIRNSRLNIEFRIPKVKNLEINDDNVLNIYDYQVSRYVKMIDPLEGRRFIEGIFSKNIINEMNLRRKNWLKNLLHLRPSTWIEFAEMIPATMYPHFSHSLACRRLCFSYEPFLDSKMVKLSAMIPQLWKINRNIFQKATKRYLKKTWSIPHSKGYYPYFGIWINIPILSINKLFKKIERNLMYYKNSKNEGPWPDFNYLIKTKEYKYFNDLARKGAKEYISKNDLNELDKLTIEPDEFSPTQILAHYQILLWLSNLNREQFF